MSVVELWERREREREEGKGTETLLFLPLLSSFVRKKNLSFQLSVASSPILIFRMYTPPKNKNHLANGQF